MSKKEKECKVTYEMDATRLWQLLEEYGNKLLSIYKVDKDAGSGPSFVAKNKNFMLSEEDKQDIDAEQKCIDGIKEEMSKEILRVQRGIQVGDIKYSNIPNVCFSVSNNGDENDKKYMRQRLTRGFDDTELWDLGMTIARFTLPRLKEYRKHINGYPATVSSFEEWTKILDKIIWSLEVIKDDWDYESSVPFKPDMTDDEHAAYEKSMKEYNDKVQEGLDLFGKHFGALWW